MTVYGSNTPKTFIACANQRSDEFLFCGFQGPQRAQICPDRIGLISSGLPFLIHPDSIRICVHLWFPRPGLTQQVPGQVLDPDHWRDQEQVDYRPNTHQTAG